MLIVLFGLACRPAKRLLLLRVSELQVNIGAWFRV